MRIDELSRDTEEKGGHNTEEPGRSKGCSVEVAGNWKELQGKSSCVHMREKSFKTFVSLLLLFVFFSRN